MTVIIPGMNMQQERVEMRPRSVSVTLSFRLHYYFPVSSTVFLIYMKNWELFLTSEDIAVAN
jgi:hypothetical protein